MTATTLRHTRITPFRFRMNVMDTQCLILQRVVGAGGNVEVIPLGSYVPLEDRAISLGMLEQFCADHAETLTPTVSTHLCC